MDRNIERERLAGSNIHAEPVTVRYAGLEKISEDSMAVFCPVCKIGSVTLRRKMDSIQVENWDRCLLCGQIIFFEDL